jgi:hypothetical protein
MDCAVDALTGFDGWPLPSVAALFRLVNNNERRGAAYGAATEAGGRLQQR